MVLKPPRVSVSKTGSGRDEARIFHGETEHCWDPVSQLPTHGSRDGSGVQEMSQGRVRSVQ